VSRSSIIRKKRKLECGCYDYAFSKNRCKAHATSQDSMKRIEKYESGLDDESVANLIDDLDAVFSKYIRLKYANIKGIVRCFTCTKELPISQIHNGHFIHRADMATRFLEDNCKPQCPACNSRHNDDDREYRARLEQEKPGITDWLREQSNQVFKFTREELKQMIAEYRWKVKLLEKKIKNTHQ
jgi:hypothetical protein